MLKESSGKDSKNILIDYAHNLGGMKAIVSSVANIYNGLVIVYGCGGRRDNSERVLAGLNSTAGATNGKRNSSVP